MAAAEAPIIVKEAMTLTDLGVNPRFLTFTHMTMESDKFICVRETPHSSIIIIDMNRPAEPLRRAITGDSALMNPNSRILALKALSQGILKTTKDHIQIFDIEKKVKMKSHAMPEVVFWKWITPRMLGLVTQTSVYHWSIEGDSEPVKMFDRTDNLSSNQIINYQCDPSVKWLVLIGIAPGSYPSPQLVKGNMQLFSVDQQRSDAVEAHAAAFASIKVSGNDNPSTLICFALKTMNAGQVISKLHIIEVGAQPGKPGFTDKQADLCFPPDFAEDFPVSIQLSHKCSLIFVITELGLLFVYDLETAFAIYRTRISPDPIILTAEASSLEGIYAINSRGKVLLARVNEALIAPFVSGQLENLELAANLAKRGSLPGAEDLVVQRFQELFVQMKYKEAAKLAAESPQGILRTAHTVAKFKSVPVQLVQIPPLLHYFRELLTNGKLNAFESLELSCMLVNQNKKNLLEIWLAEDKLECTEELGDLVKTVDTGMALKIFIKARATVKALAAFSELVQELFDQRKYKEAAELAAESPPDTVAKFQVVLRFQELFVQMKYKEASELAAKSLEGVLRTPHTVAKFQSVPVQLGQTPPLLHYFRTLLTNGKLNAFESLELSHLLVNQNKKNLLENWLAEDKLECTEELGDLVKTVDNGLALKIFVKARATAKVVAAFSDLFEELIDQRKYKEAAELAAESPQGSLLTPNTVAKFQTVPVQPGQTPPLLYYFESLLRKGTTNAFESLKLPRSVVNQNKRIFWKIGLPPQKLNCLV